MTKQTHLLAALALLGTATVAHAVPAIGVTGGNTLFNFDTATPGTVTDARAVTGLQAGETLYGVDFRPSNASFYGLGTSSRLYTINTITGAATLASVLSTALSGGSFDIGFNPVVDRLRVVGDAGQNLRINVDTGAVTTDTPINVGAGATPSVTAVAYTNQVGGTVSATTLYDIDSKDTLFTQNPNPGTLTPVGPPSGAMGLTSFDIDGAGNSGYAASATSFYTISLATGAATLVGTFGTTNVTDFAITQVPEPISLALLGMGVAGMAALRRRGNTLAA